MHETVLSLTILEIFFILSTIGSLIFNVLQWKARRELRQPLSNGLRALFNDIKSKENNTYFFYNTIFNPNNPHKDISTLKWEYGLFAQSVLGFFQGFKESLVGVLVTLNPHDREGKELARASDYGLTEQEKDLRQEYFNRLRKQAQKPENTAETTIKVGKARELHTPSE